MAAKGILPLPTVSWDGHHPGLWRISGGQGILVKRSKVPSCLLIYKNCIDPWTQSYMEVYGWEDCDDPVKVINKFQTRFQTQYAMVHTEKKPLTWNKAVMRPLRNWMCIWPVLNTMPKCGCPKDQLDSHKAEVLFHAIKYLKINYLYMCKISHWIMTPFWTSVRCMNEPCSNIGRHGGWVFPNSQKNGPYSQGFNTHLRGF